MHLLFVLLAVPVLVLIAHVLVHVAQTAGMNDRSIALVVLGALTLAAFLAVSGMKDLIIQVCALAAASWMTVVAAGMAFFLALTVMGALIGLGRLILASRHTMRNARPSHALQCRVTAIASVVGSRDVAAYIVASDVPAAQVWGIWRPKLVIATWMLSHLDDEEIDAVIAHELSHIKRHDVLVFWLAAVARDAFCYLPASHLALRMVRHAAETSADEWTIRTIGSPLALASALAKVWKAAADVRVAVPALTGSGEGAAIEARILRIMAMHDAGICKSVVPAANATSRATLYGLLTLFLANLAVMALPNACLPLLAICVR